MMEDIYKRISDDDEFGPDDTERSEIQDFFKGQTVFLTGCTGFLGKCIVEKLLRSCPGIIKIYLMVRPNKFSSQTRMETYFQHLLFNKLRELQPNFTSKVCIIEGDLMLDGMNLTDEDRHVLINEVTVIIHNASYVKFEAKASTTLRSNVLGTKCMLDLAKQCVRLKCFVYVSTAYSHCYRKHIEEKCYPSPANLKEIQDLIDVDEQTPSGITEAAKHAVCHPWVNLYTYSKSTAESLVEESAKEVDFACVIYRPSIITSTYAEPIPAWCGNFNGPALMFLATGLGIIHVGYIKNVTMDFVPADMCANALLAIIWDVATNRKNTIGDVMVYNYGTSTVSSTNLLGLQSLCLPRFKEIASTKIIGPHFATATSNLYQFMLLHFLWHFVPALFIDIALLITFRKPQAIPIFWKATVNLPKILYFGNGDWRIYVDETQKVWDRMNKRDRYLFFCDLRLLDWGIYAHSYWAGLRVYLLKDPMSTAAAGRRRYAIFRGTFEILKTFMFISIIYYAVSTILVTMSPLIISVLRKWYDVKC